MHRRQNCFEFFSYFQHGCHFFLSPALAEIKLCSLVLSFTRCNHQNKVSKPHYKKFFRSLSRAQATSLFKRYQSVEPPVGAVSWHHTKCGFPGSINWCWRTRPNRDNIAHAQKRRNLFVSYQPKTSFGWEAVCEDVEKQMNLWSGVLVVRFVDFGGGFRERLRVDVQWSVKFPPLGPCGT